MKLSIFVLFAFLSTTNALVWSSFTAVGNFATLYNDSSYTNPINVPLTASNFRIGYYSIPSPELGEPGYVFNISSLIESSLIPKILNFTIVRGTSGTARNTLSTLGPNKTINFASILRSNGQTFDVNPTLSRAEGLALVNRSFSNLGIIEIMLRYLPHEYTSSVFCTLQYYGYMTVGSLEYGQCLSNSDCVSVQMCSSQVCNSSGWCVDLAMSGETCNDYNPCTLNDTCNNGVCIGIDTSMCNDGNPCTDDACNQTTGSCVYTPNTKPCNASELSHCTTVGTCANGDCLPGTCEPQAQTCPNVCLPTSPCESHTIPVLQSNGTFVCPEQCQYTRECDPLYFCRGSTHQCAPRSPSQGVCYFSNMCLSSMCNVTSKRCL